MRPVSLKQFLAKPALLLAASLVFWGAAAGQGAPPREPSGSEDETSYRSARESLDAFCRCFGARFPSEQGSGFAHLAIYASFETIEIVDEPEGIAFRAGEEGVARPRWRLRQCVVGPSPPERAIDAA